MKNPSEDINYLFEKVPHALFVIKKDHSVSYLNIAAKALSRLEDKVTVGLPIGDILQCRYAVDHKDGCGYDKNCESCLIKKTITNTFNLKIDQKTIKTNLTCYSDHKSMDLQYKLSTSFLKRREQESIILSLEDITKQKEDENRYSTIFMNNQSVMLLIDPDSGNIIDANQAALTFYGWTLEKLRTLKIQEINTLTRDEVQLELERALEEKRNHFLFKHRLANGEIHDVEVYSGPIRSSGNKVLLSIIHDVTDRILGEKKLETSEKTSRALINATNDSAFLLDRHGVFVTMNDETARRFNTTKEELIGKNCFDLMSPELSVTRKAIMDQVLKTGKPLRLFDEREGIILDSNFYPILDSNEEVSLMALFSRDITKEKQVEKEKEKLIDELQKALKEIKTLSGLIPICAQCKKIRDDKGYWNNLEVYFEKHSDSKFSHGLCPHCMEELYGDQDWYINGKKTK